MPVYLRRLSRFDSKSIYIGLSDVGSDNPRFWVILVLLMGLTWLGSSAFSYGRSAVETVVRWMTRTGSDKAVGNVARTITAVVGVLSAIGLAIKALL